MIKQLSVLLLATAAAAVRLPFGDTDLQEIQQRHLELAKQLMRQNYRNLMPEATNLRFVSAL